MTSLATDANYLALKIQLLQAEELEAKKASDNLEERGILEWLTTVFPFAFQEEFSDEQKKFWLGWESLMKRIKIQKELNVRKIKVPPRYRIEHEEFVQLLLWGRGLGKSQTVEAASVYRGAVLGEFAGYSLYICETQDQSNEHLQNCRDLIENPESRLTEFYPLMAVADANEKVAGMKPSDRKELFITKGGWIMRAKGLNSSLRGIRIGNKRPDDITVDDIDGVNDSMVFSKNKLKQLTSSVFPTQARRHATIKVAQNLISETAVVNQIYTGEADALAKRITSERATFHDFEEGIHYKTVLQEDGRVYHEIQECAEPTWEGVDREAAQKFMNDSGLDAFLAEYMNRFDHLKSGRVYPMYDEKRNVITWSQFEKLFGVRYIPAHWNAAAAGDLGYSKKSLSAWDFVATAAENSPLPGHYFIYRSMTFEEVEIGDQALDLWESMFPDPTIDKRHFECEQTFSQFPTLFDELKLRERCKPFLKGYKKNEFTGIYETPILQEDYRPDSPVAQMINTKQGLDQLLRDVEREFTGQVGWWRLSHEKSGEQRTLAGKYGLPVHKTKKYGKWDGIRETNQLLRGTFTQPHPFYEDEQLPDGNWKLGCPYVFLVVADDQLKMPKDDDGMRALREQIASQQKIEEKLTETGQTAEAPYKGYQCDHPDAVRMVFAEYQTAFAAELTRDEILKRGIPEEHQLAKKAEEKGDQLTVADQIGSEVATMHALQDLAAQYGEDVEEFLEDDD